MLNISTIEDLEQYKEFFEKMYDVVRLVDPVKKAALDMKGNDSKEIDEVCYKYWEKGAICENCISVRAFNSNNEFYKLETKNQQVFLVAAIPLQIKERPVVLELLKDVSDSMMIGAGEYGEGHFLKNLFEEVNRIAVRDPLTGLYNRRFVDERLPVDIIRSTIEHVPLSLIFMDADDFKDINDGFGHSFGDTVLKELANVLISGIRNKGDWGARIGGDEFVLCLTDASNDEAFEVAEEIRRKVNSILIPGYDAKRLAVSQGICTMFSAEMTANEMLSAADSKMYMAKNSGKNSIVR